MVAKGFFGRMATVIRVRLRMQGDPSTFTDVDAGRSEYILWLQGDPRTLTDCQGSLYQMAKMANVDARRPYGW